MRRDRQAWGVRTDSRGHASATPASFCICICSILVLLHWTQPGVDVDVACSWSWMWMRDANSLGLLPFKSCAAWSAGFHCSHGSDAPNPRIWRQLRTGSLSRASGGGERQVQVHQCINMYPVSRQPDARLARPDHLSSSANSAHCHPRSRFELIMHAPVVCIASNRLPVSARDAGSFSGKGANVRN